MSARRPRGKRNAPVTKEKTLAVHVSALDGMSRLWESAGSRMLKPEMKYSAMNMDPSREKQKPSSTHIDLKAAGRSRPSRSMSAGEMDRLGPGPCSCLLYTSPSPRASQELVCRLLLEQKNNNS